MVQESTSWVGLVFAGGRYRISDKLGEGGMGFVYRARDLRLDCEVVIKVPRRAMLDDPGFAGRFSREIRSLVQLAHPHIVRVSDVGEHDGLPFAVMQYLSGGSLRNRQRLSPQGHRLALPPEEVRVWLPGVASALDFIHERHYIHRDVKPDNILFDDHGHVYLSDFGIAKVVADDSVQKRTTLQTATGIVLGTPQYMAPELIMGEPYDGRVDQYALAVTVYELLSGRLPAEGSTPAAILVHTTTKSPPPLAELVPNVSGTISAAVQKALSREPQDRYPNCTAFAHAVLEGTSASQTARTSRTAAGGSPRVTPAARVSCPNCGKMLALAAASQGKRVRCPSCGESFQAPAELKTKADKDAATVSETNAAGQAALDTPAARSPPSTPAGADSGELSLPRETSKPLWKNARSNRKWPTGYLYPAIAAVVVLGLASGVAIRFFSLSASRQKLADSARPVRSVEPLDAPQKATPQESPASTEPAAAPETIAPQPIPPTQERPKSQALPPKEKSLAPPARRTNPPPPDSVVAVLPKAVEKASVPERADQARAEEVIRRLYKADRAKQAPAELADKLLKRAAENKNDTVQYYVLLHEALDQATRAGAHRLAFRAIEEMDKSYYAIDVVGAKIKALDEASRSASVLGRRAAAEDALKLVPEVLADSSFDADSSFEDTGRLIVIARAAANKAEKPDLVAKVEAREREVEALRKEYQLVEQTWQKPDQSQDPESNLRVGRYLCFVKREWDEGLPLLARGNDAMLKALAEKDLAMPKEPTAQVDAGHGWWALGDKEAELTRVSLRRRAIHWYSQALPHLSGLTKTDVEKRIGEMKDVASIRAVVPLPPGKDTTPYYLINLKQKELKCEFEARFNQGVHVNGKQYPMGLWLHPPNKGASYVVYRLPGRYSQFTGKVAIGDTPQNQPSVRPITFEVWADGKKRLWQSKPLQRSGETEECPILNIRGVGTLTLRVLCPGANNRAYAVWIDPYVLK
jgi:serine/threonine-protein kinase